MSNAKVFLIISFILFNTFYFKSIAQSGNSIANDCCTSLNNKYFKSYLTDSYDILTAPANWKGNDWIKFGSVTAIGSVLYWQDENIQQWSQQLRNEPTDKIVKYGIEPWGNYYTIGLVAGIGIYGLAANDQKSREVSLIATKTLVITTAYSQLAKFLFQRHRPFQDTPPDARRWEFFVNGISDYKSFPSGHSVEAFAMATIFANAYKDRKAVPVIAYSMASMVALSRIYDNKHWASDVFIGSEIGRAHV